MTEFSLLMSVSLCLSIYFLFSRDGVSQYWNPLSHPGPLLSPIPRACETAVWQNEINSLEKLFSVKSWEEPQPSLSVWGVGRIKLLASTFILKPLLNHVKYGNIFTLIYIDFHTLRLGNFGVFAFFWC